MPTFTADGLLRVDLSTGTAERTPVPSGWRRRYIGGKGLGARYLYAELDAGTDPLGPENVLLFITGPVSTLLPGETRYAVVTKSPLTGLFLDSYAGGSFPERLAGALGDAVGLLVTGRAPDPVRVVIADGDARIESAESWGADTVETATTAGGDDAAVACIGPAGEARVASATVASDGGEHHAGRGGAGAVMGAKRLKAVVARGDPPAGLAGLRERAAERFRASDAGSWLAASGTVETVDVAHEAGFLPTRGWQSGRFDGASDVGIDAVRDHAMGREYGDEAGGAGGGVSGGRRRWRQRGERRWGHVSGRVPRRHARGRERPPGRDGDFAWGGPRDRRLRRRGRAGRAV